MEDVKFLNLEEGRPFPLPVPTNEGVIMGLMEMGPMVFIQKFGLKTEEVDAFRKGFKQYSYLESDTPVPIAAWVFDFPEPLGKLDAFFDGRIAKKQWIDSYLDTRAGGVMNALYFFLLEGKILRGTKMAGLDPEAVNLFHGTIQRQLEQAYTPEEFNKYLLGLFKFSPSELFRMGRAFTF